jgi:hypothetical protein
MHGLNCSQFKTPPDYFYAGLRVLLIDIIQVVFFLSQCMGGIFVLIRGLPDCVFWLFSSVFGSFARLAKGEAHF